MTEYVNTKYYLCRKLVFGKKSSISDAEIRQTKQGIIILQEIIIYAIAYANREF